MIDTFQTGNDLYKYSIYIALRYDVRMSSFHNTGSIQLWQVFQVEESIYTVTENGL